MAVSPVVTTTTTAAHDLPRSVSSPLKNLASGPASSNGTPKPAPVGGATTLPPTLDLAEQMNEEEKRKYAKGNSLASLLCP